MLTGLSSPKSQREKVAFSDSLMNLTSSPAYLPLQVKSATGSGSGTGPGASTDFRSGVGAGVGGDAGVGGADGVAQALNRRIPITRIGNNIRFILLTPLFLYPLPLKSFIEGSFKRLRPFKTSF